MDTVWLVIGWVLWSLTALIALFYILRAFSPGPESWINKDIYTKAFLLSAIAIATVLTDISKLHILWAVPAVFILCMAIFVGRMTAAQTRWQRQLDTGTSPVALIVRRHLEEQSGGEVWSLPEMLRVFEVYKAAPPDKISDWIASEFPGSWLAEEPGVGAVMVIRRADQIKGRLLFKDSPRFYFAWSPD